MLENKTVKSFPPVGGYIGESAHRAGPVFDSETQVSVAERLFKHLDDGSTDSSEKILDYNAAVYTDPQLAKAERELVFRTTPLVVAHVSELPNENDFLNLRLPGALVLVIRQGDGSIRAFLNSCRHRGNVLTTEPCGNQRVFSCQYHAWSYNTDGSLRSISDAPTFGDVDRDTLGLLEIPCEVRHGLVWIMLNRQAEIDVRAALGDTLDDYMASYQLDRYICYKKDAFERIVNWKVMVDAFLDNYHIRYAHSKSVGPFFHNNTMLIENYGRSSRIVSTRKSIDTVRHISPEQVQLDKHVTLGHFLWPNQQLLRQPTHFELFSFWPDSSEVASARMEIRLLVPEPAVTEKQRYRWEKNWEILMQTIVGEDLVMCENLQKAMENDDVSRLLFGKNELFNQIFHRELAAALGAALPA